MTNINLCGAEIVEIVERIKQPLLKSTLQRDNARNVFEGRWSFGTFKGKIHFTYTELAGKAITDTAKDIIIIQIADELLTHFAKEYTGVWSPWVTRPVEENHKNRDRSVHQEGYPFNPTPKHLITKTGEIDMKSQIEKRKYFRDNRIDDASPETLMAHIRTLKQEITDLLDLVNDSTYVVNETKSKEKTIKKLLKILDSHEKSA